MRNFFTHNENGHTLIEILTVAAIITILATIPIVSLREARIRANETAAIGALNQLSAAYEMYRVVGGQRGMYPHFLSNGQVDENIPFRNAEEVWKELIRQGLLPRNYAAHRHDQENLVAPGYFFSIYPLDYGMPNIYSINPWENYALALIPISGGKQPRTLASIHGEHFRHYFTNARVYKSDSKSSDLRDIQIFTFKDPVPKN